MKMNLKERNMECEMNMIGKLIRMMNKKSKLKTASAKCGYTSNLTRVGYNHLVLFPL